jgi:hypothetical protein
MLSSWWWLKDTETYHGVVHSNEIKRMWRVHGVTFQNINTQHALRSKHFLKFNNRNKKLCQELIAYFPFIGHVPNRKRRLQKFVVAAGTSLPNCYLATKGGYTLPTFWLVKIGGRDIHTDWWEGFMKYAVEMRSGTKFLRDWFRHLEVNKVDSQTHRQHGDRISLLSFFQNKESMLIMQLLLITLLVKLDISLT